MPTALQHHHQQQQPMMISTYNNNATNAGQARKMSTTITATTTGRAALIDALVRASLRGAAVPGDELARAALHHRLSSWALRVLGSHLSSGGGVGADAGSVVAAMKQHLRAAQREADAGSLDERYARLAATRALNSRGQAAALATLLALARGSTAAVMPLDSVAAYAPVRLAGKVGAAAAPARLADHHHHHDQRGGGSTRSGVGAAGQLQAAAAARAAGQAPGCVVPEKELVRDALRAAQGCSGTYCAFVDDDDGCGGGGDHNGGGGGGPFAPRGGVRVARHADAGIAWPQRHALHALGELGALYRAAAAAAAAGGDAARPRGAVRQALSAALREELRAFHGFLAGLEAQALAHAPPPPGCADEEALAAPFLTLRRLLLWSAEPARRMRLLAALADATAGADGGALAGQVWAHAQRGDPLARAYAGRLLRRVCVPLIAQVRSWVFEGRLADPHHEFFIVPQAALAGASGPRDPWREGHRIEPAKLPPFISRPLAEAILRTGKGVNFLRETCDDAAWVQARAAAAAADAAAGRGGDADGVDGLPALVAAAAAAVDARVMDVLRDGAGLGRHCDALRRYVLLGQGDFATALLDAAGPELSKPAHEVSEVTLNHLLRQALLASAARAGDDDAAERLRAVKEPGAGAREVGWDVFALHYEPPKALACVLTPTALASYRRVGRLQWRLARAERALGLAWRALKVEVERELPKFRGAARAGLERLLRACLALRADMAHFASDVRSYVAYDALEGAWAGLSAALGGAPDLDALIARHDAFLSALLGRALLDDAAAGARATLNGVLSGALGLAPLAGRLRDEVRGALLWADERAARAAANTAAGKWGVVGGDAAGPRRDEELPEGLLEELSGVVGRLAAAHCAGVRRLAEQLADERLGGGAAELRHLLARLTRRGAGATELRPSLGGV